MHPSSIASAALASLLAFAPACLGPQVDDAVTGTNLVLPRGAVVPSAYDDSIVAEQIAEFDGVDGLVPLISAFADDAPLRYWDFGPAPEFAAPLFYLVDPVTQERTGHPGIVDVIPGDDTYSPLWAVFFVPVTGAYGGHIIPSVAALEEAQRLGLVGAPESVGMYGNCPTVALDARLDMGPGAAPVEPAIGYYRGQSVVWFDLPDVLGTGMNPLGDDGRPTPGYLYRLRREGGEPLAETVRGVDMTGDGDVYDTNDILNVVEAPPIPLRVVVTVTVPQGYQSIDTTGNQDAAGFRSVADLFSDADGAPEGPIAGSVVAFSEATGLRNIGVWSEP